MENTKEQLIEQMSVQNSLSKNTSMTQEQKGSFQNVMVPFLEKVSSIQKLNKNLDMAYDPETMAETQGRILIAEQELSGLKKYNSSFFEQNMELVQDVLEEYVSLNYIEQIKKDSEYEFQEPELVQLKEQVRENVDSLVQSQGRSTITNKGFTGFSSVDFAFDEIKYCTPDEIAKMNEELKAKQNPSNGIEFAGATEFAKLDKEVTPEDRRKGIVDITKAFNTPEVSIEPKQNDGIEM